MLRKSLLLLGLIGLLSGDLLWADKEPLEVQSRITHVVAYPDRALITRACELELVKGTHEITFKNLPSQLQNESVRATTSLTQAVKILEVEVKSYRLEKSPEEKISTLQDRLQQLHDNNRIIDDALKILHAEKDYLFSLKKYLFQPPTKESPKSITSPKEYEDMLVFITRKLATNADGIRKEELNKRELDKQIRLVKDELNKSGAGHSAISYKKAVKVSLEVLKAKIKFATSISYINYGVSWRPTYDIRVNPETKETEIICYGAVAQSSGEDWSDVELSLSTARPALSGWLPELKPVYATFTDKLANKLASQQSWLRMNNKEMQLEGNRILNMQVLAEQKVAQSKPQAKQADRKGVTPSYFPTEVVARFSSVIFKIPKKANIPSDGSPHKTTIFSKKFPVKLEYISTPKISQHAYLKAKGTNDMSTPLLDGKMNVFMGGDFIGTTQTKGVLPQEKFEFTLGVDENIRVTRKLEEKTEAGPGFFGRRKKYTYEFKIKLENYKQENVLITLVDQVPVSQSSEVEIAIGSFSHEPLEQGKDGKLKWHFDLKPKETKELTFSFIVYIPKDKELSFTIGEGTIPEPLRR